MPPSPQTDYSQSKPSIKRATSLPPEITRQRSSTPISLFKRIRLTDDDIKDDTIEIEELSQEAIIPDSMTVMRDPEIEVPDDDDDPTELQFENKFTAIKSDRMHDGSQSEGEEEGKEQQQEANIVPLKRSTRKRKYTPTTDEESQEEQRSKRTVRSRTFSPLRGNN